jgi:hypothetical protein
MMRTTRRRPRLDHKRTHAFEFTSKLSSRLTADFDNQLRMHRSLILICILQSNLLGQAQPETRISAENEPRLSFAEWRDACAKLPSNRSLGDRMPPKALLPIAGFGELDAVLTAFFRQCKQGSLARTNLWVGKQPAENAFFNTDSAYFLKLNSPSASLVGQVIRRPRNPDSAPQFQPFAAKLQVKEGAEIFLHADFHGDLRSLMSDLAWLNTEKYLDGFKIARPNFHMVFFGDYADRGHYGVEVLYTLLRLKIANPDQVFLLRGNHEDVALAARYGFIYEGMVKYEAAFDVQKVARAYDFFSVVLYLGSSGNYIQCNHGGMEPGFDPRSLLDYPGEMAFQFLDSLNQRQFFETHSEWMAASSSRILAQKELRDFRPEDPMFPSVIGFMWNDFAVLANEPEFTVDPGRAYIYGPRATRFLLDQTRTGSNRLQAVFRGHQQSSQPNPMMNRLLASHGVFRHWQNDDTNATATIPELAKLLETRASRPIPQGSVWTFNVAPDSVYGAGNHYTFDTFGILNTATNFADWKLRVVNIEIAP